MRLSFFSAAALASGVLSAPLSQTSPVVPFTPTPWVNTAGNASADRTREVPLMPFEIEDAKETSSIAPRLVSGLDIGTEAYNSHSAPEDLSSSGHGGGTTGGTMTPASASAPREVFSVSAQRQPTGSHSILGGSAARSPSSGRSSTSARQREESAVKYNLRRVNAALIPLEQALARKPRYWRTPTELDDYFKMVWDMGNVVVDELRASAIDIRINTPSISDAEALSFQRQVSAMDTSLNSVVTAIIASKRDVDQIYRRKEVLDLLVRAEIETNAFIDSIVGRLSGFSQALGGTIKNRFVGNLDRGIKEYRR